MTKKGEGQSAVGALGVVFGDIGTSVLYALPAAFWLGHFEASQTNVQGIVSLIIWSITIIVSLKYIGLMMRADNQGEGGIMALVALIRRAMSDGGKRQAKRWALVGLVGVALFYGDSVITPAISVLSAVEGLQVALPTLASWTMPIALVVLTLLFLIQARGTGSLGRWFGPLMAGWFVTLGASGAFAIIAQPAILKALSPLTALEFVMAYPALAFLAMGAVVLSITGAESLYADMGHFGRRAIRRSWFLVVYPALVLNYLGQGALLLGDRSATANTFFRLLADWAQLTMMVLSTIATLIASQSVIAGAFSLTRQAVQLGYLPKLTIRHTSSQAGQIYIAGLNWSMYVAVALLVIIFGSSARLADAYGMAESGTLLASTILLMVVARFIWPHLKVAIYLCGVLFVCLEGAFVAACSMKIVHGAWVPLAIAAVVLILLTTWSRGSELLARARRKREGQLVAYVASLTERRDLIRTPGTAIYMAHHAGYAPLALHATIERLHELSQIAVIVTVDTANVPRVPIAQRAVVDNLGDTHDGIVQVRLTFGFNEVPNVPRALERLHDKWPELQINPKTANYFISDSDITLARHGSFGRLRARLFMTLHRVSAPSPEYFRLPPEQTIDMASYVRL